MDELTAELAEARQVDRDMAGPCHQLLISRDHAIEAGAGQLRVQIAQMGAELARLATELASTREQAGILDQEMIAIRRSTTGRLGHTVVQPAVRLFGKRRSEL